ncbi:Uncharacterised protein [Amycolatopsis camponoti]|uniref:Uncharacterized protein n=1 Tax=Amycolatopsis camponoti TaxID=2606593 RepID=A0A6I8LSA9_9PSEU|nr:Uncharacterised protein [Amycolatopsis camponoti]
MSGSPQGGTRFGGGPGEGDGVGSGCEPWSPGDGGGGVTPGVGSDTTRHSPATTGLPPQDLRPGYEIRQSGGGGRSAALMVSASGETTGK